MKDGVIFKDMCERKYSVREFLMYYHNEWVRISAARTIDVATDRILKDQDADQMVADGQNPMTGEVHEVPVKERLETRKIQLEEGLKIVTATEMLLGKTDEELAALWSPEALKVDEDMMPKPMQEGDTCKLEDNTDGVLKAVEGGAFVCVAKEETAGADQETAPAEEEKKEPAESAPAEDAKPDAAATI